MIYFQSDECVKNNQSAITHLQFIGAHLHVVYSVKLFQNNRPDFIIKWVSE